MSSLIQQVRLRKTEGKLWWSLTEASERHIIHILHNFLRHSLELYALCKRQLFTEVDRATKHTHAHGK